MGAAVAAPQDLGKKPFAPISAAGGIQVYLKMDFDSGPNPFRAEGNGAVALATAPDEVVSGRSLHIRRAKPGAYFGGRTEQVAVKGTQDLRIAFCVRAKGMEQVSLNFFDNLQKDNTTPTSPARVRDGRWRTVVFAVEDFHFNSDPPQNKVKADTEHTSLLLHGIEEEGAGGEYWIDKLVIYRGRDTQPPEAPSGLQAVAGEGGKVALIWHAPADNAFPAVYSIHRKRRGGSADGPWEKVGESLQPRYVDTVAAGGTYGYCVTAADYDDNVSKPSAPSAEVTLPIVSAGKAVAPSPQVADRLNYADNVRKIHAAGAGKVRHDVFLFAGDSITAADAYTHTLGQWLGRGITVRRGVGQMKTGFGKAMIGQYLAECRPEFAIVMYGTNDGKGPEDVKQAMENLAAVIDTCARQGTVPILATIPPRGYDKTRQAGESLFNLSLIGLCRQKKVPVSYCFEEMMDRDLKQMLGDGVHLTPVRGNDAAGEALWKTIEQVYFALRDTSGTWK
jgi:hypothetical protein